MLLHKVIDYVSWTLLIITIILLKFTSNYVENIVYGKRFAWNYFLVGLALATILTFILYKLKRDYYEGGEKRASAILSLIFSIIISTIFLSAFYTYHTGKKQIYYKQAFLQSKGSNIKTGTKYVHLIIDGREERFNPKNDQYEKMMEGDTLILTIGKGRTNYDFIYEFKKK